MTEKYRETDNEAIDFAITKQINHDKKVLAAYRQRLKAKVEERKQLTLQRQDLDFGFRTGALHELDAFLELIAEEDK